MFRYKTFTKYFEEQLVKLLPVIIIAFGKNTVQKLLKSISHDWQNKEITKQISFYD